MRTATHYAHASRYLALLAGLGKAWNRRAASARYQSYVWWRAYMETHRVGEG